jgi:ribosome-associated toxin RatA of RatAB toxin-antitoxin module
LSLGGKSTSLGTKTASQKVFKASDKLAEVRTKFVINAPPEIVWQVLTNFSEYPNMFRRLESCRITKQEGNLVWTESDLKPHVFVRTQRQHTINDLSGKPSVLDWQVIDGNFKTVIGKWELSPVDSGNRCAVIYTLAVDTGPIIPKFLVSFALRNFQKEIGTALKQFVETTRVSTTASRTL